MQTSERTRPLPLGTMTEWGRISAVGFTGGERYYWITDEDGAVAMMPADFVEPRPTEGGERR